MLPGRLRMGRLLWRLRLLWLRVGRFGSEHWRLRLGGVCWARLAGMLRRLRLLRLRAGLHGAGVRLPGPGLHLCGVSGARLRDFRLSCGSTCAGLRGSAGLHTRASLYPGARRHLCGPDEGAAGIQYRSAGDAGSTDPGPGYKDLECPACANRRADLLLDSPADAGGLLLHQPLTRTSDSGRGASPRRPCIGAGGSLGETPLPCSLLLNAKAQRREDAKVLDA